MVFLTYGLWMILNFNVLENYKWKIWKITHAWPGHETLQILCLDHANNKGADQPEHYVKSDQRLCYSLPIYIQNLNTQPLAGVCGSAGEFVFYLVRTAEDPFPISMHACLCAKLLNIRLTKTVAQGLKD